MIFLITAYVASALGLVLFAAVTAARGRRLQEELAELVHIASRRGAPGTRTQPEGGDPRA